MLERLCVAALAWAFIGATFAEASLAAPPAPASSAPVPLDVSDLGAPVFTVYSSQDGLSDEIWSTIGFDRHGFVWAGSASELARFDGYRWTAWPFADAKSLVRDMQLDGDGVLWAIFEREGLARYDGRAWALYSSERLFHQRFSDTVRPDGTRDFWVAYDRGFWRHDAGRWLPDTGNPYVASGRASRIEETHALFGERRQWMASAQDGLWYRRIGGTTGPWVRFENPEFDTLLITDLLRASDRGVEELWVLTYGNGLRRIRDDGVRMWRSSTGELPSEALYSARVTYSPSGERTVWIASRAGLLRVGAADTIAVFDRRHGLPSDAVRGLKLQRNTDGTDLLWLATEGGVARAALADSQWLTVSLLGARYNGTFAVLLEPDDGGGERLWVGTAKDGIGLLRGGAWRYYTKADGTLPAEGVRHIARVTGPSGRTLRLVGLSGGEVLEIDDALAMTPFATPWPKQSEEAVAYVLSRRADEQTELWFGLLRGGIWRLRGGEWTHFTSPAGEPLWTTLGLAEQVDAHGRSWLWAATSQGLARFDGARFEILPSGPNLPVDGHRGVTLLRDGERTILWTATNRHGVVRLDVTDPGAPVALGDDGVPPAPDPTVYSVHADSRGRVYVCTNNGVQQLTPRDGGGWIERVFRRRDGVVHDECNTNSQFVDRNDRYWVGTLGGLSVYDPTIQVRGGQAKPKPLHVTAVRADGVVHDPLAEDALDFPAGTREVRIDYSLLAGVREHESTYRSQLVGFDPAPGAWTTEHTRAFTGLEPGDYRLEIEARDYAGTAAAPRALAFHVRAHWWQLRWVQALWAVLFFAAAGGLTLGYNRALRARQRELEREVAARTAELSDANARLTDLSYADPLTGVANRRRLTEALDAAIERAVARQLPVGVVVVDVDRFKEYNDRFGHLAGDTALRAVAQALESATREQDLVARFGGEEFACLMVDADLDVAASVAERMRALVEALPPRTLGNDTQTITLSAGVLSRVPRAGERAADLLREADAALYEAKRAGRNCVKLAGAT